MVMFTKLGSDKKYKGVNHKDSAYNPENYY